MEFVPNPNAVQETVEHMLNRTLPGGGKQTIDDACWWAYGNHDKAAWYRALYEQAEVKWKALQ